MTDALMGFTLGFALVLAVIGYRKATGMAAEWRGTLASHTEQLMGLAERVDSARDVADAALRLSDQDGNGASDAAIAQLALRISKIEKASAAQDLTILDTAERVAHKLQDRQRKRTNARELDEEEDVPTDPNLLLARARQFYGAAPRDEGQMQLDGIQP